MYYTLYVRPGLKSSKLIIAVLLVLIVGVAIYFGSQKTSSYSTNPTSASGADNSSASLKTFSNKSLGISFLYPDKLTYVSDLLWKFTQNNQSGTLMLQNYVNYNNRPIEDTDFQFILLVRKDNGTTPEQFAQEAEKALGTMQISTIDVGGVTAVKASGGEKIKAVPTVWLINKGVLYVFQLSEPNSTNAAWFDQILSSFKFTN